MFIIDFQNKITNFNFFPDGIRGEIGVYYHEDDNGNIVTDNFSSNKIAGSEYNHNVAQDNSKLTPIKKSKIFLKGSEDQFRNQTQWEQYIQSIVSLNTPFVDHTVTITVPEVSEAFLSKVFHHPEYENSTKIYPTKKLINYNLNKYPYLNNSSQEVKNIAMIKTQFDVSDPTTESILNQLSNRILNFTGSAQLAMDKQSNIFILHEDLTDRVDSEKFPYFLGYDFDTTVDSPNGTFNEILKTNNKRKNVFKNINSPSSFLFGDFFIDNSYSQVKVYDIFDLSTKSSISEFFESDSEIFLLENQAMIDLGENSFVEGIEALHFLSSMRNLLESELYNIQEVIEASPHKSFLLGYKIEKYIDNDVGGPIQTFYTINTKFTDTQLKYGRKYIYKIKALIGVFGTTHRYTGYSSSENPQIINPSEVSNPFSNDKFWCTIDAEVRPSFKLLEIDMGNYNESFIDSPTQSPNVEIYCRKNEPRINFLLRPRGFQTGFEETTVFGEQTINLNLVNLKEGDKRVNDYVSLSNTQFTNPDYFTGIYEVFKIDNMPKSILDFEGKLLMTIDEKTGLVYPENYSGDRIAVDNLNATFSQKIPLNKKCYYLFRAVTFHGTPSPPTEIYEVELLRDSDEYKFTFREIEVKDNPLVTKSKSMKRIMSIEPNYERLIMSEDTGNILDNEVDSASLATFVDGGESKVFKVRITSKHTGKKIDINLRFKIVKDGTFTN